MTGARFFWAVIGDAAPEPVAVVEEDGRRVAYTCGCADPFPLDDEPAAVRLISPAPPEHLDDERPREIPVPPRPGDRKVARDARDAAARAYVSHGWRRFNP